MSTIDMIILGGAIIFFMLICWVARRWYLATQYEKRVRTRLKDIECPLFDLNILMKHYEANDHPAIAAGSMYKKWKRLKDANKNKD